MNKLKREEQARVSAEILAELVAEEQAHKEAVCQAKDAANWASARDLDAHLPCRVQVVAHETDEEWETHGCDRGRIGWVRIPSQTTNLKGGPLASTYIEDMTPGDDNNPTRYHEPRHIRRLPP
jgi:hypothetical protein